jgi:hypothetical protein
MWAGSQACSDFTTQVADYNRQQPSHVPIVFIAGTEISLIYHRFAQTEL